MAVEDKKPVPPRPPPPPTVPPSPADVPQSAREDRIPVALVYFERPIQYPGRQSDTSAKTMTEPSGRSWKVEYCPTIRHFRILYTDGSRGRAEIGFVPECRALSWLPA